MRHHATYCIIGLAVFMVLTFIAASYIYLWSATHRYSQEDGKEAQNLNRLLCADEKYELVHRVRILCWIMTCPQNLESKAIHVKRTWAYRCNKYIFFSSQTNESFPTVGLNVSEGRGHLTAKTMKALRYIYENHFDDADWFLKADDDTFVIVENLKYFVSGENTSDPVFFGHHFLLRVKQGYFSGGAGYVLSKEALKRFGKFSNTSLCRQDGGSEDVEIGKCMENLGVRTGTSSDRLGRSRFHCFSPKSHLLGTYPDWFIARDALGAPKGRESISDYAISFHYMGPADMYVMEYFAYHFRTYGMQSAELHDINQQI